MAEMRRVVSSIFRTGGRWDFIVAVDGEEYASGTTPSFWLTALQAAGYVNSLTSEANQHLNIQ